MLTETQAIRRIVRALLAHNYTLAVEDGNDGFHDKSRDAAAIVRDISDLSDEVTVRVYMDATRVGALLFIYGNAPDGSEVLADYSVRGGLDQPLGKLLDSLID